MTKEQRIVCSAFPRRLVATDRATQHKRGSRYWEVSQCLSLGVQHTLSRSGPEAKNPRDEIQPLNWHLTAGERKEITDRASNKATDAAIEDARDWVRAMLNREPAQGLRQPVEGDKDGACRIAYVRAKALR
jgi:hypothetical protein